ncbi:DUF7115 domain-containing protein [Natrinema gelatinilyticum]|uniref:DUF7115 domain-containing protein n=1 Tax=Natrinema gelatinilyticum TaxID=2961571 RepID=UPI0020C4841D|nr:hypothetical protein [Natrinema gelatinilyticum]
MSVPGIVHSTLDGEEITTRVSLGSDDELFITPTRTIVYRADGLLSDESADEFPHDADRLTLSEGRRKTKFTLEYALDGDRSFAVPAEKTDDVLHPVLAGVLDGNEITGPGEAIVRTYRFSELTLTITSNRLVKQIGGAVWDEDYEEYHFDDVTKLAFEDGSVAIQIVLTVNERPQRIKVPNEEASDIRERLQRALFAYHGVSSLAEFNSVVGDAEDVETGTGRSVDFGGGVDPLGGGGMGDGQMANSEPSRATENEFAQSSDASSAPNQGENEEEFAETASFLGKATDVDASITDETFGGEPGPESVTGAPETDPELLERLEALEAAVERQSDIIERQQGTIDKLIAELRQGR